jgi:hypothetical protein
MATKPLTLKGVIDVGDEDTQGLLREWRREKQQLEDEARALRTKLSDVEAERDKLRNCVGILRRQLSPLHHALRAVFGEIELAVGQEEFATPASPTANSSPTSAATPSDDARWQAYRNNFPGVPAAVIDVLLANPAGLNINQIAAFLRRSYDTAKQAVARLKASGAVVRDGSTIRLNR